MPGDNAGLLQRLEVDAFGWHSLQIRQAHFRGIAARRRNKAALWQAPLQRHLAALESDFVETAGARSLSLVSAARSLAQSRSDAAPDAAARSFRSGSGFDRVQLHGFLNAMAASAPDRRRVRSCPAPRACPPVPRSDAGASGPDPLPFRGAPVCIRWGSSRA